MPCEIILADSEIPFMIGPDGVHRHADRIVAYEPDEEFPVERINAGQIGLSHVEKVEFSDISDGLDVTFDADDATVKVTGEAGTFKLRAIGLGVPTPAPVAV